MSYARIRAALRKCCGYHDEEESQLNPVEAQPKLTLTCEQLQACLSSLHGNWGVNLEQKLDKFNAKLNDYLPRYYDKEMATWLVVASMQPELRLVDGVITVAAFHRHMVMPEWHKDRYVVTKAVENYYNAAVFANCLVYFANSVEELKTLHADTVRKFKQSLSVAPSEWQHFTVPPIFLIVTDLESELRNKEVLGTLPVPILHSICVPSVDIPIMSYNRFDQQEMVQDIFWQSLIKYTIAPCYEKLAVAAGLIDAVRLPLENKVATTLDGFSTNIHHLDNYSDHDYSADSSDSDEEEVGLTTQVSSVQPEQAAEQVVTTTASASTELTVKNTETVSTLENADATQEPAVTFKP